MAFTAVFQMLYIFSYMCVCVRVHEVSEFKTGGISNISLFKQIP